MAYDFEWHRLHADRTRASAAVVLSALHAVHPFRSALDVGCGTGIWLKECRGLGAEVFGVDGPWTKLSELEIGEDAFAVRDLSQPLDLGRRFDLCISLEVAEHLPPEASATFVDNLVGHADCVLFSAAIPFQGGYRHVNERWQSFWAGLFRARGFRAFDPFRRLIWDRTDVHDWYKQNTLLYAREDAAELIARIEGHIAARRIAELPVDIVHPAHYERIASYRQIAFRPLARRLPVEALRKVRSVLGGRT